MRRERHSLCSLELNELERPVSRLLAVCVRGLWASGKGKAGHGLPTCASKRRARRDGKELRCFVQRNSLKRVDLKRFFGVLFLHARKSRLLIPLNSNARINLVVDGFF